MFNSIKRTDIDVTVVFLQQISIVWNNVIVFQESSINSDGLNHIYGLILRSFGKFLHNLKISSKLITKVLKFGENLDFLLFGTKNVF